ncbi:uncharacterized protein TNCV_2493201 [Trichonephila clavipes]|uniref:Uncharacterized protein n=1 Tax=Trichonephila clavipes TaxID=2585209 RepID=A0A8X6RUQ7_TRICX|nr:uncharacterized protein TNCV_2493201 [Trichonephila clavipes]
MDHVILNQGQVTWTTPELAPPLLTTTPHQREDVSALDRFNVHRCPTRWVFSGTGLEPVTKQATARYLYHSATAATRRRRHSGWKSQWIKECPPGDKRRSLSDQRVCRLGRCRQNGSKEQRRWDRKKELHMPIEKCGAIRFQTGRECICVFRANRTLMRPRAVGRLWYSANEKGRESCCGPTPDV